MFIYENVLTFTIFIDLHKVFDCVDREFYFTSYLIAGIDGKLYFAIKNLYTEASVT